MAQDVENIILSSLIHSEQYCRKVLPHLKLKYFDGGDKVIYDLFLKFMQKYNKIPTPSVLEIEFKESKYVSREDAPEVLHRIKKLGTPVEVEQEWLLDRTENWCKERAINLAIIQACEIIDGESGNLDKGAIPKILSDALAVTFDTNVGHDYIENADSRYEFYHKIEEKIPFDLDILNKITNKGIAKKTLNCLLASTGVGKSLIMCHLAGAYLSQGKNVLYVTLEMAEERIAERIDANLFDVDIHDIEYLDKKTFTSKIDKIKAKNAGKLIIKEYPTSAAHVGHLRALLSELKLKKQFQPDIIFVDYLNIMCSERMKSIGGSIGSYNYIKSIAEELRGLAVEYNLPIWTATQTNRNGADNSDVEITDTSESFGLPATVDLLVAAIRNEQLDKMNQIMFKQLKNRYNDLNGNRRFVVGIDRPKMKLLECEQDTSIADTSSSSSSITATSQSKQKAKKDFSDFQY